MRVQSLVDDFAGNKLPPTDSAKVKKEASPVTYLAQKSVPFLTFHRENDAVVLADQSRILQKALKKAGRDSTYFELKGEGHGLVAPAVSEPAGNRPDGPHPPSAVRGKALA